jgi:hypothetical protein
MATFVVIQGRSVDCDAPNFVWEIIPTAGGTFIARCHLDAPGSHSKPLILGSYATTAAAVTAIKALSPNPQYQTCNMGGNSPFTRVKL